ncbi:hypothetical protein IV498_02995 [Paenarthrobacter sp. Z7-10]|uniref:hypothetical protein n=1 Tax=Paenarthrobacter sp. Z7-10 TaxID=2787635 RepID=UPI0022A925B7|nr:hypothetical protein [Paenarthrobacter sp. Z7-10]MCZ2402173.1 hypothetical protein [Paenarthrobacter sp. Z7-10]
MINWGAFLAVAIATIISAVLVVGLYSVGVRLYAVSVDEHVPSTRIARVGAYVCFALCAAAVLYGIYLIVPAFHPK